MASEGKHAKPKKAAEGPTQVLLFMLESRSMLNLTFLVYSMFLVLTFVLYLPLPNSP